MGSVTLLATAAILAALLGTTSCQDTSQCGPTCQLLTPAYKQQLAAAKTEKSTHPLDPLTWTESTLATKTLFKSPIYKKLTTAPADQFVYVDIKYIMLLEPPKAVVLAWSNNKPLPPRKAYAPGTFYNGSATKTITFYIDFKTLKVTFTTTGICNQGSDFQGASQRILQDPGVITALGARSLAPQEVNCLPGAQGAGDPLVIYTCHSRAHPRQPIGLSVTFDQRSRTVVQVHDDLSPDLAAARPSRVFKPATIERPQGVSFQVKNRVVTWGKWTFHVQLNQRVGLVVSQARFEGSGSHYGGLSSRSVLYQGHLSELFVPYMNPDYLSTYFDAGAYGLGTNTRPLVPLTDCPKNAHYIPAVFPSNYFYNDATYDASTFIPNAICIFERYSGDVALRHIEDFGSFNDNSTRYVGEPRVSIVARTWATVGNYDYGIDWEFFLDGTIKTTVNVAGFIATTYSEAQNLKEAHVDPNADGADGLYGTYVTPGQIGVIHDHFANFRLDVDVDGPANSFVEETFVAKRITTGNGFPVDVYEAVRKTAVSEKDAQYDISVQAPAEYVIVNPSKFSYLGNPVGYRLVSHGNIASLLASDDGLGNVAGFHRKSIWVTAYDPSELWAAGTYTDCFQEDGLPFWAKKNRAIKNKDIVVWHTIGVHHVPVQEDWYLMPTLQLSFELKPHNFFSINPSLSSATPYTPSELRVC